MLFVEGNEVLEVSASSITQSINEYVKCIKLIFSSKYVDTPSEA